LKSTSSADRFTEPIQGPFLQTLTRSPAALPQP
jgi:hypothetical protein